MQKVARTEVDHMQLVLVSRFIYDILYFSDQVKTSLTLFSQGQQADPVADVSPAKKTHYRPLREVRFTVSPFGAAPTSCSRSVARCQQAPSSQAVQVTILSGNSSILRHLSKPLLAMLQVKVHNVSIMIPQDSWSPEHLIIYSPQLRLLMPITAACLAELRPDLNR